MSTPPEACTDCLRRAWLLRSLSGHIETAAANAPGRRAQELLALGDDDLARALRGERAAAAVLEAHRLDPNPLRESLEAAGVWACCPHGRGYPPALRGSRESPRALFGRGDPSRLAGLDGPGDAVCVVGARRPSSHGARFAEELARELAAAGLAVVSGMALGIDSRAHTGALAAGGLTVAVLGSGADVPYPPRKRRLYEQVVERGVVLSELPPGSEARRWTFPARNRIMAGLAAMTVVVEARERSGSLITAGMASDLGREVGAVPGRVGAATAAGVNALLHDGAHVVRGAQDVLDSLLGAGALRRRVEVTAPRGPALEPALASVLELVEAGAGAPDAVVSEAGLAPAAAAAALTRLELLGYLRADSAGRYERTTLEEPSTDRA